MFVKRLYQLGCRLGRSLWHCIRTADSSSDVSGHRQTRPVEADAALQISTVYACIELLANTISSLPICVYKALPGGGREQNRSSPLWFLLHDRPNAWMTPAEFISSMCLNRLLKGNAYAQVVRDSSGDPIALIPLAAEQMEVSCRGWWDGLYLLSGRSDYSACS